MTPQANDLAQRVSAALETRAEVCDGYLFGSPATSRSGSLDELGSLGIVPIELALEIRPLAGFRNALVHGYLRVDVGRVHAVLIRHLDQLREFASHVEAYLARSG